MFFAGDTYHMNHLKDNTTDTKETIEFFKRAKKSTKKINLDETQTVEEQLKALEKYSKHIFVYADNDNQDSLYFTRILSPSFLFTHEYS